MHVFYGACEVIVGGDDGEAIGWCCCCEEFADSGDSRLSGAAIEGMGRIICPKSDGHVARFAITYILDDSEDPALGAHEPFLGEIIELAGESANFTSASTVQELTTFLSP